MATQDMATQEKKLQAANSKLMLYEAIVAEYYQAQRTVAPPPTAAKQQFAYALEHEEEQPKGQWGKPNDADALLRAEDQLQQCRQVCILVSIYLHAHVPIFRFNLSMNTRANRHLESHLYLTLVCPRMNASVTDSGYKLRGKSNNCPTGSLRCVYARVFTCAGVKQVQKSTGKLET